MPNYNQPHQFYAGVDLHARSMFVHILSAKGKTVFERDLPAEPFYAPNRLSYVPSTATFALRFCTS
jgi:hypothetical protein